jgi:hypothetical protein
MKLSTIGTSALALVLAGALPACGGADSSGGKP